MSKVTLTIEEKLRYQRRIAFVPPEGMNDDLLDQILDEVEGKSDSQHDFISYMERHGFMLISFDPDYDSPDFGEVECLEFDFVKGE